MLGADVVVSNGFWDGMGLIEASKRFYKDSYQKLESMVVVSKCLLDEIILMKTIFFFKYPI